MPENLKIRPLHTQGLADYHVHCDFSVDATGTVSEYCQAALRRELAEICFTTHYDTNPAGSGDENVIVVNGERRPAGLPALADYLREVRRAQAEFYPLGLSVKAGVEIGWWMGCEKLVEKTLSELEFDYVLCGVHEIESVCFCCRRSYERCFSRFTVEQAVEKYIREVSAAIESGLFQTIAHVDYLRKYGTAYYGPDLELALTERLPEIFPLLDSTDTSLEINTSALRRGFDDYHPSMRLLNMARRAGVEIDRLGSDAHRPSEIGFDFDAAAMLIPEAIGGCESL